MQEYLDNFIKLSLQSLAALEKPGQKGNQSPGR
jgi:hypothetical protein